MVDIDMVFRAPLLTKILTHTKLGQAYMPIVFSQFEKRENTRMALDGTISIKDKSSDDNFLISTYQGFWRTYGFGMVSVYKDDLIDSGGYDMTIKGWGMEDVELADALVQNKVRIIRAKEPDLIHVFHDKVNFLSVRSA